MDNRYSFVNIASVEDVSGAIADYQNMDVILPHCTDLDWAQIIYVINYKRILFIHRSSTWLNFYIENSDNVSKYGDYTIEELSYRFLQRVLPNIYEYELTEDEFHLLNLINLHPHFEKTSTGFKIVERKESLLFPWDEAAINSLISTKAKPNEQSFLGSEVKFNNQIITIGMEGENVFCCKFNFNAENAALISVALCSDQELPNCELFTIEEVFKRLKAAKTQFENNAQQLENVNLSLDDLLKKVHTLSKLKEAVSKLVDSSFCQQVLGS